MKKVLNIILFITFVFTNLVPITGINIHKMLSSIFLLMCIVHVIVYRKKLKRKSLLLMSFVMLAFISGVFGFIFDQITVIVSIHKIISIFCVFFLAIHIFIFHKNILYKRKVKKV